MGGVVVPVPGMAEAGALLRVLRAPADASASAQEDPDRPASELRSEPSLYKPTQTYTNTNAQMYTGKQGIPRCCCFN